MKAAAVLTLLLPAGCRQETTSATSRQLGRVTVRFRPTPDPPLSGQPISFTVALSDAAGPVTGASVEMALHPQSAGQQGLPVVMREETGVAGRYVARGMTLAVPGLWEANVRLLDARHGTLTTTFRLQVLP